MANSKLINGTITSGRFGTEHKVKLVPSADHPELKIVSRQSMAEILSLWEESTELKVEFIPAPPVFTMHGTISDDTGANVEAWASYNINLERDKNMDIERLYLKLVSQLVKKYGKFDVAVYGEDAIPSLADEEAPLVVKKFEKPASATAAKAPEAKPAETAKAEAEEDADEEETFQEIEDDLPEGELPFDVDEPEAPVEKPAEKKTVTKAAKPYKAPAKAPAAKAPAKTEVPAAKPAEANSEIGNTLLGFGKYKEKTIAEVTASDRKYLVWFAGSEAKGEKMESIQKKVKTYLNIA